ncbi:unnamed protein product, partial [Closterium sp. NIES-54]
DSDDDDAKDGRGRSGSRRPRRGGNKPHKEKQSTKTSTSAKDADSSAGGNGRDDKAASCSLVGVVEPTVSLVPEAGEDFQVVAAAVQANPKVVLLDSRCSHHLMGTKEAFVNLGPSSNVKHVRGFNGALQDVQGRSTVALQGEAGKQVLIPDVLYVPGVRANLLSAGQLKEHGMKLQEDGDGMLLVLAAGEVLGRATYTARVLCTDLRTCSAKPTTPTTEVVALQSIVSVTKATPDRLHARLAHVGMDTIRSSAKHEVATGLDLKSASGANSPCVSCVGRKLARHTFPDQGSVADEVLAIVHIDLCGPFRVAAKDDSLYLLLKDRKTRYVWVKPVAKKSDALPVFVQWLAVAERQTKKSVLMLRSNRGGEFLGKQFADFVNGKGIVHDLTCPYTPQQNGMAEREMRTVVESVRTMLLHMGVQHHWWHLALRQAVWVRNYLERSALPPRTTPYQLLTGKKPDLSLARVWGCMAQFLVPERGGKLQPKARWGLHLDVSEESKGCELLDIADNRVVTTSDVVFYESMSLEVWKSAHGPTSRWIPVHPPTDTSTATLPLLAEVGDPAGEDVEDVPSPCPSPAPPLVTELHGLTPMSASGDEGRSGASPVAPEPSIAGGRHDAVQSGVGAKLTPTRRQQVVPPTLVKPVKETLAEQKLTGEQAAATPTKEQSATGQSTGEPTTGERLAGTPAEVQQDAEDSNDGGDAEEAQPGPRRSGQLRRPPDFFVPAAFTTVYDVDDDDDGLLYDDAEEDEEFPELDPDMLADPEHRWDISTMTVKEALASWKGSAVKAAMEEEIRSLINMGTWELVECPLGVNIMKSRWVLTTKYHIDDTVEQEKARLVVKGFTQVYDADYDETFAPVGSYVTLRIFLSIVAVLNLNLMQLDMKDAFLQSKLNRVLYMTQPDYFNDGTGRVCKLLKSLYGLKQSPLLWYLALNDVLVGAGWKKSQDDEALYFKVGDDGVACWALVYVDNLLATSSSAAMLEELKELLEAAFELCEISPVQKYLGLEIICESQRIKCATLSSTESEYVAATEAGKERRRLRFLLAEFRQLDTGKPTVLRVDNKSAIKVAEGMGLTSNFKHMERRQASLQHMVKRGKFSLRCAWPTRATATTTCSSRCHALLHGWCDDRRAVCWVHVDGLFSELYCRVGWGLKRERGRGVSTGVLFGPILAWAEPTSWSDVRGLQPTCSSGHGGHCKGVEQKGAWLEGTEQEDAVLDAWLASWTLGRRPGKVDVDLGVGTTTRAPGARDAALGVCTASWGPGRRLERPGGPDADLGFWSTSREAGRRSGGLQGVLGVRTPTWRFGRCPGRLDAGLGTPGIGGRLRTALVDQAWLPDRPGYPGDVRECRRGWSLRGRPRGCCAHLRSRCTVVLQMQRCAADLLQRWHTVDLQRWHTATLQRWSGASAAALEGGRPCCAGGRPAA